MQENEERNLNEETSKTKYKGFAAKLDNYFEITKRGSTIGVEIFAGIATFLAMAYILTVNPNTIVGSDSTRWASIFIATVFGAFTGTMLMAFLAKLPYAQAPGMGLNAMISLVLVGAIGGYAFNFNTAMLMVLISGLAFLLVSIIPCGKDKLTGKTISLREKIFDGIPKSVRTAIPVGIGLFIAYIGFQNAKIIQGDMFTISTLIDFTNWTGDNAFAVKSAIVCFTGLFLIIILSKFNVKGSVIIGILGATILAAFIGVTDINILKGSEHASWKFWENFKNYFKTDETGAFGAAFFNINIPKENIITFIMLIITFGMIDMFDTMGTVVGCATKAGLVNIDGKPIGYNKVMYSDSIATVAGAIFGTSTVTTYVESGAGIAAGGKTGLTAFVVAILFLLSIFLMPVFAFIPSAATASALIYVGVLMMSTVKDIDFSDPLNALSAFLAIVVMPLGYSITDGIGVAILAHVILSLINYVINIIRYAANKKSEKPKWPISVVTAVVALLFCLYFFIPMG